MSVHRRRRLAEPPRPVPHQGGRYYIDRKLVDSQHEIALTIALVCNRALFGRVYAGLQSDFFWAMPKNSGVLIKPAIPTRDIIPRVNQPGDIDLLIIPYHESDIILDRIMAVEIKAIRATYEAQGKSPNKYGFTQASALSALGFPYVGVVHLIVSDVSPESAWRPMSVAKILDKEGNLELLPDKHMHDMLPDTLLHRAYGRLKSNSHNTTHGLAAVYVEPWLSVGGPYLQSSDGYWMPNCRTAELNPAFLPSLTDQIANYYENNSQTFLVTPRHDPI